MKLEPPSHELYIGPKHEIKTEEARKKSLTFIREKHAGKTHLYTDGSKNPSTQKIGAAFVIMSENKSFLIKLNSTLSVFSAELTAIRAALIWLKARHLKIHEAVIFTDSLSSIQVLKAGSSKSRPDLVNHILKLLDESTRGPKGPEPLT